MALTYIDVQGLLQKWHLAFDFQVQSDVTRHSAWELVAEESVETVTKFPNEVFHGFLKFHIVSLYKC